MRTEPYSLTDIVDVITRTFARMQGAALEAGEFADLSIRQITCLELIAQLVDPTATDLARTLRVTKPTVSALLARLLQNDYVRKERSPTDARSWHVHLTCLLYTSSAPSCHIAERGPYQYHWRVDQCFSQTYAGVR